MALQDAELAGSESAAAQCCADSLVSSVGISGDHRAQVGGLLRWHQLHVMDMSQLGGDSCPRTSLAASVPRSVSLIRYLGLPELLGEISSAVIRPASTSSFVDPP